MYRGTTWGLLLLVSACSAQIAGTPLDETGPTDASMIDGQSALTWSTPKKIDPAATAANEDDSTLSSNALELFFSISSANGKDLYYSKRASTSAPWTTATALAFNDPAVSDETPRLSADDKILYFASRRAGNGTLDIYAVTRPAPGSPAWTTPAALLAVNTTTQSEKWYMPCGTNRYVMVQSPAGGDSDLVEGTMGGGAPTPITTLNSTSDETGTFVSPDCLTIYFASTRTSPGQIYRSQRAAIGEPWQTPSAVTDFASTGGSQEDPWLSADGKTFVFAANGADANNKDIYISTR